MMTTVFGYIVLAIVWSTMMGSILFVALIVYGVCHDLANGNAQQGLQAIRDGAQNSENSYVGGTPKL